MFSAPGDGYSRFPQACFAGIKKTDKETDQEDELRKRMKKTGDSLIEEDRKPGYNPDDWGVCIKGNGGKEGMLERCDFRQARDLMMEHVGPVDRDHSRDGGPSDDGGACSGGGGRGPAL